MPYDLNYYLANLVVYFLIYCVLTLGLNVSFGMAGLLDFAFITYMAMGAYFAGVTALGRALPADEVQYILGLNWPFPVDLIVGAVAAGVLGLFVGLLAIRRLRSDYLAIALVAVWTIAWSLTINLTGLFNGNGGLIGVPQPLAAQVGVNPNDYVFVFIPIAAIVVVLLLAIAYCIENSPFGRALRAVREDQDVAAAFGKRTIRLRLTAYAIGCVYAGIAGALTIEFLTAMNPNAWAIVETVIVFAALIVGGRGNIFGAILGALLVRIVIIEGTGLLPPIPGHEELVSAFRNIAIGLLVIAVLYFRPDGVLPERRRRYFEGRQRATPARSEVPDVG